MKNEITLPDKFERRLKGFPKDIVKRMMECQEEQGNKANYKVFEDELYADENNRGFAWEKTKEGYAYWRSIIDQRNFKMFKKLLGYKPKPTTEWMWLEVFSTYTRTAMEKILKANGYIAEGTSLIENARKAGVLDLWFDKVYEEEDKQKKIVILDSEEGRFELEVSKEGIYYRPENVWLSIHYLQKTVKDAEPEYYLTGTQPNSCLKRTYPVVYTHVTLGCKKSVPIRQLKTMLEYYDSIE